MTHLSADDRTEITEALALLGHLADTGRLDRFDEVFTADAGYDLSDVGLGAVDGIEEIRAAARRLAGNPVAHHTTDVVITAEPDGGASATSKGLLLMADGTVTSLNQQDVLRREGGRWRIARRTVTAPRAASNAA